MLLLDEVNWPAVLLCAVVYMIVGALWYSPLLFGKAWLSLTGKASIDPSEMKKGTAKTYSITFAAALLVSYMMAQMVQYLGALNALEGAEVGFLIWAGFVATSLGLNALFEAKPFKLYLINSGAWLVKLVLTGIILALWV